MLRKDKQNKPIKRPPFLPRLSTFLLFLNIKWTRQRTTISLCVVKEVKELFVILSSALFHDENLKKQQVYLGESSHLFSSVLLELNIKQCCVLCSDFSVSRNCCCKACRCDKWITNDKHSNSNCPQSELFIPFLDEFEIYNYVLDTVTFSILLQQKRKSSTLKDIRRVERKRNKEKSFHLIWMDTEVLKTNLCKFMC